MSVVLMELACVTCCLSKRHLQLSTAVCYIGSNSAAPPCTAGNKQLALLLSNFVPLIVCADDCLYAGI